MKRLHTMTIRKFQKAALRIQICAAILLVLSLAFFWLSRLLVFVALPSLIVMVANLYIAYFKLRCPKCDSYIIMRLPYQYFCDTADFCPKCGEKIDRDKVYPLDGEPESSFKITRKQIIVFIGLAAAVVACAAGAIVYIANKTVPVVNAEDIEDMICMISVYGRDSSGHGATEVYNSNKAEDNSTVREVLTYLSTCKMKRRLFNLQGHHDIEFNITDIGIAGKGCIIEIYSDGESKVKKGWLFEYEILNGKEVLENLREIAGFPDLDSGNAA